ncbi:hypothetical protein [Sphingorhabdus contaminans]|uniref:hypothetical protein n=1 Tax=Sphingorhabdus contaminans TaxID=1343899 RepID=UPI003D2BCC28
MSKSIRRFIGIASVLALTSGVLAQNERNDRRSGGSASASSNAKASSGNPVKRTWDFTKRFGIINLGGRGGCGAEADQAQADIDASNRLLSEFLAGPTDPKKLGLERKKYLGQVLGAERSIDSYLEAFNNAGQRGPAGYVPPIEQDICLAKGQRMSIVALRDSLAGIAKIYPDMTEVGPILGRAESALKKMGDDQKIAALVASNRGESLAAVRLNPALSTNAEWISGFRAAFPALVPGQTILKIHPYSAAWYVHKNEITSYPEYRQIGAWVAARKSDNSCWIYSVDLWQNYDGGGYEHGQYKLGGPPQQILCENL